MARRNKTPAEGQTQISIRVPASWIADLDTVAERLSRPGLTLNRADAVRMALGRGLEEMKAELKAKR